VSKLETYTGMKVNIILEYSTDGQFIYMGYF